MAKSKYHTHVEARFGEIQRWLEAGATDKEIIKALGLSHSAFYDYKKRYKDFADLILKSRRVPVMEIKAALFRRATGYTYIERTTTETDAGMKVTTSERHLPPDPASAMILLKHWAKDEGWTNDPQSLEMRRKEYELKKRQADKEDW